MSRDIFRKIPLSEKKQIFREGSLNKMIFTVKGEADELVMLSLDEYVGGNVLVFNYMPNSPRFSATQKIIMNFNYLEDRYFIHTTCEAFENRVHVSAHSDVYVLQRRKSPRLEMPDKYPGIFNILKYDGKPCLYETTFRDFSSGGCRVVYRGHLPLFKLGDQIRGVIHLNHRNPVELDCEVKHHVMNAQAGEQTFGIQFKLNTTILENKMLVVFMDLQRELFVKWNTNE